ncbi:anti-sigma factor [Actinosynnema sp. NPDC020468]|uniref:anti-sigma factor n=1 Tax=Actinosynnema sp. NPDC020468 TaxID=3154488 RepID=UPI0033E5866D
MTGEQRDDWCPQEELAVGWAMHALEPDEEARLRDHLPGCTRCREAVRSTQEVTAALGGSVRQYEPPARLKARLMEAIEHTPQERVAPEPALAPVVRLDEQRSRPKWGRRLVAAAAALVVLAVIGVAGLRFDDLSDRVAQQDQRTNQLESALQVAADPTTNRAVLRTDSGEPLAVLLSGDHNAAVMPMALKSNDRSSQIYVVWGISTPDAVPLATFDVSSDSDVTLLSWSTAAHAHNNFAISLEPGRTAPSTPTNKVAAGQVAS